jgi:hypothetical protein
MVVLHNNSSRKLASILRIQSCPLAGCIDRLGLILLFNVRRRNKSGFACLNLPSTASRPPRSMDLQDLARPAELEC